MSIAAAVGAMSNTAQPVCSRKPFQDSKAAAKGGGRSNVPGPFREGPKRRQRYAQGMGRWRDRCSETALGFFYLGPIDGHDLTKLLPRVAYGQGTGRRGRC